MKVVIFGATGMVGQGVLRECLLDPDVESVLAIVRKTSLPQHVKRIRAAKYTVDGGARGMREVFRSASWPPRLWA